jgi:hypothetical protein
MTIRYDFYAQFEVIIHDYECISVLIYYTDGSRKDGLVEIGIKVPLIRHYVA